MEQLEQERQMLRNRRAEALRVRFRENYGCEHAEWERIRGRGFCDGCGDYLRVFLHGCIGCRIRICTWCRAGGGARDGIDFM